MVRHLPGRLVPLLLLEVLKALGYPRKINDTKVSSNPMEPPSCFIEVTCIF